MNLQKLFTAVTGLGLGFFPTEPAQACSSHALTAVQKNEPKLADASTKLEENLVRLESFLRAEMKVGSRLGVESVEASRTLHVLRQKAQIFASKARVDSGSLSPAFEALEDAFADSLLAMAKARYPDFIFKQWARVEADVQQIEDLFSLDLAKL